MGVEGQKACVVAATLAERICSGTYVWCHVVRALHILSDFIVYSFAARFESQHYYVLYVQYIYILCIVSTVHLHFYVP